MKNKYFWLIFPFLEPLLFKNYAQWVDILFSMGKIISLFYIIYIYFRRFRSPLIIKVIILYQLCLFISTILNPDGDIKRYLGPTVSVIGVCLYIDLMVKKGLINIALKYISQTYIVFCIINCISIILRPDGYVSGVAEGNEIYFLGLQNRFAFVFLPLIAFQALHSILTYGTIQKKIFIITIINTLVLIYFWAVGGMLALILICFLFFFIDKLKLKKLFNSIICSIIVIAANISLVFLRVQENYADFITDKLQKDVTLSGRTLLWDYGLLSFLNNPIWGIGYNDTSKLPTDMLEVSHMHNLFMNIIYYGGIVSLILFLTINVFVVHKLYKYRKTPCATILVLTIFTGYMMSLGDTFDNAAFWMLIMLAYNINKITKNKSYAQKNIYHYGHI